MFLVDYVCDKDHRHEHQFDRAAEATPTVTCPTCGEPATRAFGKPVLRSTQRHISFGRRPWEIW